MSNFDKYTFYLTVIPYGLLILFVIFKAVKRHTKTKIDDEIADALGDTLEGLGKPVPKDKELPPSDKDV